MADQQEQIAPGSLEATPPAAADAATLAPQERRETPSGLGEVDAPPRSALVSFIGAFKLHDIFSTGHHSEDFVETRAEFILLRLRFMVFFYAVAVALWVPVDYLLLSPAHFGPMLVARLALVGVLLPLGLFTLRKLSSAQVHAVLAVAVVGPCLFYAAARLILSQGGTEIALTGYFMMPYLIIAMLGLFPLTLVWGAALIATILLVYLGLTAALGLLMSGNTLNELWALLLFGGISLWIQSGQLLMLLRLYRESTQDPLTGLINRRVLMKRLSSEIERVNERKGTFCVLMFDLDRFKRINDNHGHLTGDKVLKITAHLLQLGLRQHDLLARFGGEEFVAVLHGANCGEAIKVAERIRAACYQTLVSAPGGQQIRLSTSVGVTQYEDGEPVEAMLARVDDSLYKAKELGRNRVVHSQSDRAMVAAAAGEAAV